MAGLILWRVVRAPPTHAASETAEEAMPRGRTAALGLAGGFLDAIGGGGWGATVAGTLLGGSGAPRQVIGSTNAAEFFVTLTVAATFFGTIGLDLWPVITGLVIGGVLAAPLAGLVARHFPPRLLMVIVGCAIAALALRGLGRQLGLL
jgi:uncharacterized membrane protein YfcA